MMTANCCPLCDLPTEVLFDAHCAGICAECAGLKCDCIRWDELGYVVIQRGKSRLELWPVELVHQRFGCATVEKLNAAETVANPSEIKVEVKWDRHAEGVLARRMNW
jgi:hypothetical protein